MGCRVAGRDGGNERRRKLATAAHRKWQTKAGRPCCLKRSPDLLYRRQWPGFPTGKDLGNLKEARISSLGATRRMAGSTNLCWCRTRSTSHDFRQIRRWRRITASTVEPWRWWRFGNAPGSCAQCPATLSGRCAAFSSAGTIKPAESLKFSSNQIDWQATRVFVFRRPSSNAGTASSGWSRKERLTDSPSSWRSRAMAGSALSAKGPKRDKRSANRMRVWRVVSIWRAGSLRAKTDGNSGVRRR